MALPNVNDPTDPRYRFTPRPRPFADPEVGEMLREMQMWAENLPSPRYTVPNALPANPRRGDMRFDETTGGVLVYYGKATGWQKPWNVGWGRMSFSSFFDVDTSAGSDTIAVNLVLTDLIVNRLYRCTWHGESWFALAAANDTFQIDVTKDSTVIVSAVPVQIITNGSYYPPGSIIKYFTTTAASHTFRAIGKRLTGTGTFRMRGYLEVLDIGPNGNAPSD